MQVVLHARPERTHGPDPDRDRGLFRYIMILEKSVRGTVRGGDQEGKENCWLALNAVVELDARRAPHHASISMPNPVVHAVRRPSDDDVLQVRPECINCTHVPGWGRLQRETYVPSLVVPLVVPLVIPMVVPPVQEWVWQTRFSRCVRRVPL